MRKSDRYEDLAEIFSREFDRYPVTKGRRIRTNIDYDIEDGSLDSAEQFGLRVTELRMQPT